MKTFNIQTAINTTNNAISTIVATKQNLSKLSDLLGFKFEPNKLEEIEYRLYDLNNFLYEHKYTNN